MRIERAAPAKVNLELRVGSPDSTGYHPLATLFCALDLADTVILETSESPARPGREPQGSAADESGGAAEEPAVRLEVEPVSPLAGDLELGEPASNLAVRAAHTFFQRAGRSLPPLRVRLVKRIPPGGGLGGGSSDAAAVLRGLDRLYPDTLGPESLRDAAESLGSDVPFFLLGRPLAVGAGRGERLTAVGPLPSRPVLLVLPPFGVSTAAAYRWLDTDRSSDPAAALSPSAPPSDWRAVGRRAHNDLQAPVTRRHPRIADAIEALADAGADIALMSGSGSTAFGVFRTGAGARAAERVLRDRLDDCTVVRTATRHTGA